MNTRRTFIKFLSFFGALIIPWTILPQKWSRSLSLLVGKPPIKLDIARADGADGSNKIAAEILAKKGFEDIQVLCQVDMQGRRAGTIGETRAYVYLEEQLRALQLEPFGDNNYLQTFSIPEMAERVINGRALFRPKQVDVSSILATNLLAGIKGANQNEAIIISAHYDHLGIYNGELHRGANDNASGVGCILEVMRRLVQENLVGLIPKINIVAVFWGAEEMGFLGSKYFVKNPTIPLSNIRAIINFDTIATGIKEEFIFWVPKDNSLIEIVKQVAKQNGARIEKDYGNGHKSDESSFLDTSIPALTVLSKAWLRKNHTPEDDITIINEEKLKLACNILYDTVKELAY
ncbi:MAG: peptidase M28 [Gracilibacter sp. BRH_c7a]|nr:MAG: peptidase M28 [Gracilibacter sp. BRH_c7a]